MAKRVKKPPREAAEQSILSTNELLTRLNNAQCVVQLAASSLLFNLPESEEASQAAGALRMLGKELSTLLEEISSRSVGEVARG